MTSKAHGRLEHVEYESYPSSDHSPPKNSSKTSTTQMSPTKKAPTVESDHPEEVSPDVQKGTQKKKATKTAPTRYTGAELASIGKQCSATLPPASAVQAMFLYELQRKAEDEKFFHSRMFQLRREEEAVALERSKATQTIQALETRIKQLEKVNITRERETHDRISKSKSRISQHQDALDQHTASIDDFSGKLETLTTAFQTIQTSVASQSAETIPPATIEAHANALAEIQTNVLNLFDDRDGMITLITDTRARVTKLEDNVRALTLQNAAVKSPSALQPHRLPMKTSYGEEFDLAIPKGKAHIPRKSEGVGRKALSAA